MFESERQEITGTIAERGSTFLEHFWDNYVLEHGTREGQAAFKTFSKKP